MLVFVVVGVAFESLARPNLGLCWAIGCAVVEVCKCNEYLLYLRTRCNIHSLMSFV